MSFPMQDVSSRRPSGSSKPERTEQYEYHAQDTSALTDNPIKTVHSTGEQSRSSRHFAGTWTVEILCWLLALISLVIILIVLGVFNSRPLSDWHSGLSLNTLINIASQVAQTAVLVPIAASISQLKWIWYSKSRPVGEMESFDQASRGPVSSLWLVAKHPRWVLVYLGALNTSLLLLLGPFAQQSVSLPLMQRNLTGASGSAPLVQQYQIYSGTQSFNIPESPDSNTLITQVVQTLPASMEAAVITGLLTKDAVNPSAVPADCQTANCTFPDYSSLAVCSAAKDVTPTIVEHCPRGVRDRNAGCSYTLPPLREAATVRRDNFTMSVRLAGLPSLWIGASENQGLNASRSPDLAQSGANPANMIQFYILFFPDMTIFSRDSTANVTASLVALQVSLSLCLKVYHTTVVNGTTVTTITDTQKPNFAEKTTKTNPPTDTISTTDTDGKDYWIEGFTASAFNSFLAGDIFYGTYSSIRPDTPTNRPDSTTDAARAIGDTLYNEPSKDHIAALQPLLANLETSMSNAMRTTSSFNASASGTASYCEAHISVNLRWMIVPILSIALAFIFLVSVMVETRTRHVPAWKDGLNHVLFALEPELRAKMENMMPGTGGSGRKGLLGVPVVFEREGGRGCCLRGPGEEWWTDKSAGL